VLEVTKIFKFLEISDNISETVQDRDIVAMEDQWEIVCGLSNGTIDVKNDFTFLTFCILSTFFVLKNIGKIG